MMVLTFNFHVPSKLVTSFVNNVINKYVSELQQLYLL